MIINKPPAGWVFYSQKYPVEWKSFCQCCFLGIEKKREIGGLLEALDRFKLKEGLIILEGKEEINKKKSSISLSGNG